MRRNMAMEHCLGLMEDFIEDLFMQINVMDLVHFKLWRILSSKFVHMIKLIDRRKNVLFLGSLSS